MSPPDPPRPPEPSVPPELAGLADYRVERLLGQGGMGAVYLARNLIMDRPEVLKVVGPEFLGRPGARERFQQEIRSAGRLQHPNIVTAYSCLRPGDLLVFAMEYVDGRDLTQVVKEGGPLPAAHACHYARQAALGLQHAHEKGMVHRDVKPANLMLAREGKRHVVKVLDFGLAKTALARDAAVGEPGGDPVDPGLTGAGRMLGTPDYIAPEQTLDAARADIRSDIYSLGCTLYFLLAGRPPFTGRSLPELLEAHHSAAATPLDQVRPDVPPELAAAVARMMAKGPADRFQTPLEVAQALLPFAQAGARGKGTLPDAPAPAALPVAPPAVTPVAPPTVQSPPTAAGPADWTDLATEADAPAGPGPARPAGGAPVGWVAGAGAAGVLVLGLVAAWAAGAFRAGPKEEPKSSAPPVSAPVAPPTATIGVGTARRAATTRPPDPPPRPVESRFAPGDADGWRTTFVTGEGDATAPVRVLTAAGNTFLQAADRQDGRDWGWSAPAKYLGNRSAFYGRTLRYELRTNRVDAAVPPNTPAVRLSGGGLALHVRYRDLTPVRAGQWTRVVVRLDPSQPWFHAAGGGAGEPALRRVLGALTGLWIQGEYFTGGDAGDLDNVTLGTE